MMLQVDPLRLRDGAWASLGVFHKVVLIIYVLYRFVIFEYEHGFIIIEFISCNL